MLRLLWLILSMVHLRSDKGRALTELQAHVVSLCWLLSTADMFLLHSYGATSTDMLLHILMEITQQWCWAHREWISAGHRKCLAEPACHRELPAEIRWETHTNRNGSGYIIRQMPCLMLLTLKCTKACYWGHSQWQKPLGPSETGN